MVELEQPRFICHVSTTVITSLAEAEILKDAGNDAFRRGSYHEAEDLYRQALTVAPSTSTSRAIYYGNKAACHMHLKDYPLAIEACNQALRINPKYIKVWMRRSNAYEKLNALDKALDDARRVLEIDPEHQGAKSVVDRLGEKKTECDDETKKEMLGKLKDLGNAVLGPFGVSVDDFKAERDPETGSYSLSFKK